MKVCPNCGKSSQLQVVSYPEWVSMTITPIKPRKWSFDYEIDSTGEGDSKVFDEIYCPECDYNYHTDDIESAWNKMDEVDDKS